LGRYEHARARRARAMTTQSFTAIIREGGGLFLRTVELGGTELGTLRTCARGARARAKNDLVLHSYIIHSIITFRAAARARRARTSTSPPHCHHDGVVMGDGA
jgi:hypothetical protein